MIYLLLIRRPQASPSSRPSRNRRHRGARRRPEGRYRGQRSHHRRASGSSASASRCSTALLRLTPSAAVAGQRARRAAHRGPDPRRREQPHLAVHRRHPRQRPGGRRLRRASSCSTPTSPRGSRSCAGRNRRCGAPRRSAESSRSTAATRRPRPLACVDRSRLVRLSRRASVSAACRSGASLAAARSAGSARDGIDSFGGGGDRDGYRNLRRGFAAPWPLRPRRARRGRLRARPAEANSTARPLTFERTDTLDVSRNRLAAGRLGALRASDAGLERARRRFAARLVQPQPARRATSSTARAAGGGPLDAQLEYRFATGGSHTSLILAARRTSASISAARDILYRRRQQPGPRPIASRGSPPNGASELPHARARRRRAPRLLQPLQGRDDAPRFGCWSELGGGFAVAGSYAEGIAQPTFFDLYGFFPGNFAGNPSLKPESSRGFEGSLRFRKAGFDASLTAYRQRLRDEIVESSTPRPSSRRRSTARSAAAAGASRPSSAGSARRPAAADRALRLSATRPQPTRGQRCSLREMRRPKHSGSVALDGASGRLSYGASLAYVGRTATDSDFDVFPALPVRLDAYWLAGARVAYAGQARPRAVRARLEPARQRVSGYVRLSDRRPALFAGLRLGG